LEEWCTFDLSNKRNKTHAMKSYIATLEDKKAAFNKNNVETMWFSANNRKDAEVKARRYARNTNCKFVSIRLAK